MNNVSKHVSVETLAEEYLERKRRGESPAISEYTRKYPQLAGEIEDIFPAMELMEDFKPASGDLSDESNSSRPAIPSLKQVADYRILKEIGRGGMGVVYEAEQQSLGRRVALKVLPESSVGGTKMLDRFQREARAAAKMHHTNIVPVFEVGQDDQCAFYAMQLIQGQGLDAVIGDLRDLRTAHGTQANADDSSKQPGDARNSLAQSLVTGRFDCAKLDDSASKDADDSNPALIETIVAAGGSTVSATLPGDGDVSTAEDNRRAYFRSVAEIGHQCAEALSYAHARGIIHRDVKPSNLLLDTNGVVWVTDFGLAKTGDVGLTQTGDILGTIRYMSPERFKGQCDNRADVYSLGLTLYELLVLTPAYESPDRLKLIDIVTKTEVTAPRSIDSRIPRDLETIVLKACDKDPKRRYQSADDMADDLQKFLNDEPILARRVSPAERAARWARRNPWLATAMSVAGVALLAITGISMVAAQTQTQLNGQLAEANEEQKQLNAELTKKTEEQRTTNQALIDSNKSKEELIRDLKKSQSSLAEKQAEFVAEKGDLAESMLWLAKSHEFADGQSREYRRNLLNKLQFSAIHMPRLASVEITRSGVSVSTHRLLAELQDASDEERRRLILAYVISRGSTNAGAVVSDDQSMLALHDLSIRELKSGRTVPVTMVRAWDVKSASFTGRPIIPNGAVSQLAIHSGKRILATMLWKANSEINVDDIDPPSLMDLRGTVSLAIWSIDSGELLSEISVEENVVFRRLHFTMPLRFSEDGKQVVRVSGPNSTGEGIVVHVHDVKTCEIVRSTRIALEARVTKPLLSRDCRRLVCHAVDSREREGKVVYATLRCYDVDTGEQVYDTIRHAISRSIFNVRLLSADGVRVAIQKGSGKTRRIEVFDFNQGGKVGPAIKVDHPAGFTTALLNANVDGTRLAVSAEPPRSASQPLGFVQVFDVATGSSVVPRLPTNLGRTTVAMPASASTITVPSSRQINTWQLPHVPLQRALIPGELDANSRGSGYVPPVTSRIYLAIQTAQRGGESNAQRLDRSFDLTSGRLSVSRSGDIVLAGRTSNRIEIQRWDRKSSRLKTVIKLPGTESDIIGGFSPGGTFLMTVHLALGGESEVRIWNTETGASRSKPFELQEETYPLAVGPDGESLLLAQTQSGGRGRRGGETKVIVINLSSGKKHELTPSSHATLHSTAGKFSTDGRYVVLGALGSLRRFDLRKRTAELSTSAATERRSTIPDRFGLWALNGSGQLIASAVDDRTIVQFRSVDGASELEVGETILEELKHPASITGMAFDPEGRFLVTSASDGIIRQWSLPEQWEGDAAAIRERVERHTGLMLTGTGDVALSEPVDANADQEKTTQLSDATASDYLADDEREAIRLRNAGQWEDAEEAFADWASKQPHDWRPDVLRLRPLVQLNRFDEVDAAWKRAANRIGNDAAFAWLKIDATQHSTSNQRHSGRSGARYNNGDPESASIMAWYNSRLLDSASDDAAKADLLFDTAKAHELNVELEKAAMAIDEAIGLQPDSADMHYYRGHLMERLNRWDEALQSRKECLRLEPEHRDAHYRVVVGHHFSGDKAASAESWSKYLSDNAENLADEGNVNIALVDRLAKTRLFTGGTDDEQLKKALELADANFDDERGERSWRGWVTLTKGLAEYRRGKPEHHEAAIEYLDSAMKLLSDPAAQRNNFARGVAMTRFIAAMAHHHLGHTDAATDAYFDGLDRHTNDADYLRSSSLYSWTDWKLAEVARREAALLLRVDETSIDETVPNTSRWKVLLAEDFDDELSDDWQQVGGKWTVVGGAACGTLEKPEGVDEAYGRLEREIPGLPTAFEVRYEVWTSTPMLAACFLRKSGPADQLSGHRVALASYPDRKLTNQGKPGKGLNLVVQTEFGYWVADAVSDLEVKPNQHYKVRIIRQPQRITVFIDGKQVMSHRVRNIDTKTIHFFARGEEGAKMFIDNFRIRAPAENPAGDGEDKNHE